MGRGVGTGRTNGVPPPNTTVTVPGRGSTSTGGSFDFNHRDLVSARQSLDLNTDDHIVKSYNLLNRIDTLFVQDARLFADYLAFYDAFPDLKHKGRAEPGRDWGNFTAADRINEFTRDELKEYYAQLNFIDTFAMRVGKQQVIWSEADALHDDMESGLAARHEGAQQLSLPGRQRLADGWTPDLPQRLGVGSRRQRRVRQFRQRLSLFERYPVRYQRRLVPWPQRSFSERSGWHPEPCAEDQ
jgi:uncharacterized protein DUF1302